MSFYDDRAHLSVRDPSKPTSIFDRNGHLYLWFLVQKELEVQHMRQQSAKYGRETDSAAENVLDDSLCPYCAVFFKNWEEVEECCPRRVYTLSSVYYHKMHEVSESADQGCKLCAYVLRTAALTRDESGLKDLRISRLRLTPSMSSNEFESGYWWLTVDMDNLEILDPSVRICLMPQQAHEKIREDHMSDKEANSHRLGSQSFESSLFKRAHNMETSLILAQDWLRQCLTSHSGCKYLAALKRPRRLIKIGSDHIQLYTTQPGDQMKYITLSHRWGEGDFTKLTTANYDEFCEAIPYAGLSHTFRDAIEIARRFGVTHVWIDSLCIIQNDRGDWEKESAKMSDVYKGSTLNIAATAASCLDDGYMKDRDTLYAQAGRITASSGIIFRYVDHSIYYNNLQSAKSAPLWYRGWVVQERFLAPRTLHLAETQLFWECHSKTKCETFPVEVPETFKAMKTDTAPPEPIQRDWPDILEQYTGCRLTFSSDRLVAIAGVAEDFAMRTSMTYRAGLWLEHILTDACWTVCGFPRSQSMPREGTSFPSWSWAAHDGVMRIPSHDSIILRQFVMMTIESTYSTDNRFGDVVSARLLCESAHLKVITNKLQRFNSTFTLFKLHERDIICDIHMDLYPPVEVEGLILFLPIVIIRHETKNGIIGPSLHGLILQRIDCCKGHYQRLGQMQIPVDEDFLQKSSANFVDVLATSNKSVFANFFDESDCISKRTDDDGRICYSIAVL